MNRRKTVYIWTEAPRSRARRLEAGEALGRWLCRGARRRRWDEDRGPVGPVPCGTRGRSVPNGDMQDAPWPWWDGID